MKHIADHLASRSLPITTRESIVSRLWLRRQIHIQRGEVFIHHPGCGLPRHSGTEGGSVGADACSEGLDELFESQRANEGTWVRDGGTERGGRRARHVGSVTAAAIAEGGDVLAVFGSRACGRGSDHAVNGHRARDEDRAVVERSLHRGREVWHLQREADLPADTFPRFQLVNHLRLSLVEQFERGLTHFEHECAPAVVVPDGGGFETKSVAIKFDEALIVAGGDGDAQLRMGGF